MKILVADDEERARRRVVRILESEVAGAEIVVAEDGAQALDLLESTNIDVAFLDIDMPHVSGLDVAFSYVGTTRVVFVTAFDDRAVKAFEADAVDYVLKPFSQARLLKALAKARSLLAGGMALPDLRDKLVVKVDGRHKFLPIEKISVIMAQGDYVEVFCDQERYLIEQPLKEILARLPQSILQIHRSYAVQLDFVDEIFSQGKKLFVRLADHWTTELVVSDSYKARLRGYLETRT